MAHAIAPPPRKRHGLRRPKFGWALLCAGAGVLAVALVGVLTVNHQHDAVQSATAQANAANDQAQAVADPILQLCAQGGDVAQRLSDAGLCGAAAAVKAAPRPDQPDGLTSDQVHALVQQELAKRPPQQVGPTQAQLTAAIQAVVSANPDLFKAPAPTAAQIQAAVNAYLRVHPIQQSLPPYPDLSQYQPVPGLGGYGQWMQPGWPSRFPRPTR